MKFRDVIYYLNCVFIFKFYHNLLPSAFHYFLLLYQAGTSIILDCLLNQRFVFLLAARTNYGKFNIRFKGAVDLWNNVEASLKILRFDKFKCFLKKSLIMSY